MRRGVRGASVALALFVMVLAGLVVAPAAGAQTQVFSCSYTVGPQVLPPGGGFVTVAGTAPGSSVVRIFVNGVQAAVTNAAPVTGTFSASVFINTSAEISVGVDDYPNTPCIGVGGENVNQDGNITVGGATTGRSRLALTGASGTGRSVLLGLGAVSLGAVLVVAARRRQGVRGRS